MTIQRDYKKEVQLFYDNNIPIHVNTHSEYNKEDNYFNGYIIKISADFFMITDRILPYDIPIFFQQITKLEVFTGDYSKLRKPIKKENDAIKK